MPKYPFARFRDRLKSAWKGLSALPTGNYLGGARFGASRAWFYGLLPGAKVDYQRIAGDKWKNAIVAASLAWIARNLPQAPPCIYKETNDGEEKIVPGHPLTALLKRPNPFYDGRTLRQATFLSLIAGGGNAYWWVKRGPTGLPLELWYLPHFDVWPLWNKDSTTENWIVGYAYRQNGQTIYLTNEEVIHFRDGLDPENQRSGLDPLKPGSREIVADNESSSFQAALLHNMGVVGCVISPAERGQSLLQPDADELKAQWEEATTGDNRGRPLVLSGPVKVDKLALSPSELLLDKTQHAFEARICALIGVNAVVLGLPAGLEHSTYSNMEEAERAAWRNGIIPRLELMNSELDTQLLAFFPNVANLRVGADYRRVIALQDSLDDLFTRYNGAVQGPWVTPNEARAAANLPPIADKDELYPPKGMGMPGQGPGQGDDEQDKGGSQTQDPFAKRHSAIERVSEIASERKNNGEWVTIQGHPVLIGGDGSSGHGTGKPSAGAKTPKQKAPTDEARSMRAKQSSRLVGADVQRYSEEHCEPILAKAVGGVSLRDNEPVDVIVIKDGIVAHGIELKTMTDNKHNQIHMKAAAVQRKAEWMEKNHAPYHTVVFDDHAVFNKHGAGQHGHEDERKIFYRRGFGSFRVGGMYECKDHAELNKMLNMKDADLPKAAAPLPNYPGVTARKMAA